MKRHLRIATFAGSVMMLVLLLGGLGLTADSAQVPEVKIDNFSFGPATVNVAAGATVTWINRDDIPHTVVSSGMEFKSKALDTDERFSYTFSKAGTYSYFCSLHPKMTGQIVVQ
jgi:plastocyanin